MWFLSWFWVRFFPDQSGSTPDYQFIRNKCFKKQAMSTFGLNPQSSIQYMVLEFDFQFRRGAFKNNVFSFSFPNQTTVEFLCCKIIFCAKLSFGLSINDVTFIMGKVYCNDSNKLELKSVTMGGVGSRMVQLCVTSFMDYPHMTFLTFLNDFFFVSFGVFFCLRSWWRRTRKGLFLSWSLFVKFVQITDHILDSKKELF